MASVGTTEFYCMSPVPIMGLGMRLLFSMITVLLDQAILPQIKIAIATNYFICSAVWESFTFGYLYVKVKYFCVL